MASRREYELLFKLRAALGPDFGKSFAAATSVTKGLESSLTSLQRTQSKIAGYQKQAAAIEENEKRLQELTAEQEKLTQAMAATDTPSAKMQKQYEANAKKIEQTTAKIEAQKAALSTLGNDLEQAGVDTANLTRENERLADSIKKIKENQEQYQRIKSTLDKDNANIAATKTQLATTLGAWAALAAALYAGPIKASEKFESNMADVAKVVDGLKDSHGNLTAEYANMRKELLDLSTVIPMTAEELTQIAAAAGQSGIARAEISAFATDAAKMGIAFDTTAEQAGEWMAKWRTSFKMGQDDVRALADQINYLSNNSAATAPQIAAIVTKVGPLGEVAGLSAAQIAALGDTMVGVGINEDVAATGIRKLATTMTAGTAATKRQQEVLQRLGIDASALAQRMQVDAQGAIMDFLAAVKQLPEAEQTAALKNYFGEESVGAIAPLLTSTELLAKHFGMVGDAMQYAGSMEGEYASRSDTTENKRQLALNSLSKLAIVLGDNFLPLVGTAAEKLTVIINRVADFAAANPELVQTIAKVVAGMGALKIAGLAGKLGFLEIKKGVDTARLVMNIFHGKLLTSGDAVGGFVSKLKGMGGGAATYLKSVGAAFGNLLLPSKLGGSFAGLGSMISGAVSGLGGKITAPILTAFGGLKGKLGGVLRGAIESPIGGIVTRVGGKLGGMFGGIVKALGPVGNLISTAFGPLGGIAGKVLPVVGIISAVIAVISILKDHLGEIREFVGKIFGDAGLQVFDTIVGAITNIGNVITGAFSPENMAGVRDTIQGIFGEQGVAVFDGFMQVVQAVAGVVQGLIDFSVTYVKPVIEQIFGFIVNEVLPIIAQKFAEWAPTISSIISGLGTAITTIATTVMQVIQFVMPTILQIVRTVVDTIGSVIGGILQVIQGVITFVTGVFTGNWRQAWEGVKQIFSGVWDGIVAILKGCVNGIISAVNLVIKGLNLLKVPDWVPGIGGKGINIPLIPMLAKGARYSPDTFIAGEKGPELVTNAPGRTVFTAQQTNALFNAARANAEAAQAQEAARVVMIHPDAIKALQAVQNAQQGQQSAGAESIITVNPAAILAARAMQMAQPAMVAQGAAAEVAAPATVENITPAGDNRKIEITNSPTYHIDGGDPADIEQKLEANNRRLIQEVKDVIDGGKEDDERTRY